MPCDKNTATCELTPCECKEFEQASGEVVKKYGLNLRDVFAVLKKYGPAVLKVVTEALEHGFSWETIKTILELFGPFFLQEALKLHKGKYAIGTSLEATEPIYGGVIQKILVELVKNVLPLLLDKYGPVILEAIKKAILDALEGDPNTLVKAVNDALAAK
jgi:hypothetical protein